MVASAGNAGANNDNTPHFPSDYSTDMDHVISVASIDQNGQLAGNSNYGQNSVDVTAPGVSIYSTTYDGKYGLLSGTSMAAPLVAAAAAILAANDLYLSPAEIKARILEACTPSAALAGKVSSGGILNVGQIFVTAANDPPIPPSRLQILTVGNNQITLEWQDNSTNETGFELQMSTDGGATWTALTTAQANQVTQTAEFRAYSSCRFRVRAANDFGVSSWAAVAVIPTEVLKKPGTPSGGKAKAASATEMVVTWKPATNATAYRVERALSAKGAWQEIYLGSATTCSDNNSGEGLNSSTKYYYRVTAINFSVESKPSASFSATTAALPPEGMPENVTATAESSSKILVTWQAVKHATQYLVERSTDGITWRKVKTVSIKTPDAATEAAISGHKAGTTYYFRVTAASPAGSSEPTAAVQTTTFLKTPGAPRVTVLGSRSVLLKWTSDKNAAGYRIERALENSTDWMTVAELEAGVKEHIDTEVLPNTAYRYRLITQGVSVGGESIESAASKVKKIQTAPMPVENLEAFEIEPRQVTLMWKESAGATRYLVQHFNGNVWRTAGTTKYTSITIRALKAETVNGFRVVAVGKNGNADSSSELEIVTPIDYPNTPGGLRVVASGPYTATLTWKEAAGADFYRVYRFDAEEREWIVQADNVTELSFVDDYLEETTHYQYRVFSVNSSGESLRYASVSTTTLAQPTVAYYLDTPDIVSVTKSSVRFSFKVPEEGRLTYRVQWSEDGGVSWLKQKMYTSTQGQVVVTMLHPATDYVFRIRLENRNIISDWSDEIDITTLLYFEKQPPVGR